MATKGAYVLTYRDLMSRLKGDKTFDREIVEVMLEQNPMLEDMVLTEANDGSSNKTTIRTGLPDVAWTSFYEGVQGSKGSTKQIRNTAGRIQTKIEIASDLYDQATDKGALILDEVGQHSQAMMNEMADCLIYGKIVTEPKKFNGLVNFYSQLGGVTSTDDKLAKHYVFDALSTSQASEASLRSIFLVGWSQKSIRAFYPRGTSGGLKKGELKMRVDAVDADNGGTYEVNRQYLEWQLGLDVRDFRYGGRLANIQSDEMFDTSGVPNYWELLRRLTTRVRSDGVRQVFYMDKLTWEAVCVWADRKTASNAVKYGDLNEGIPHKLFGITVRECDALNTNETKVTA